MLRNIFTVLSGTVLAQLIALMGLPLLGRLYDPADFGLYQVYMSSLTILLIFAAMRFEVGLFSAEPGAPFRSLLGVTLLLCLITPLIGLLGVWVFKDEIKRHIVGIGYEIWLVPVLLLVGGIQQTLSNLPIRYRDYRLAASGKVIQSSGYVVGAIVLAFTPFFHAGMVLGDAIGRGLAALRVWWKMPTEDRRALADLTRSGAVDAIHTNRALPLLTMPGALLSAIAAAMVPIAFARLFSLEVAGQYSLVERFVLMPVGMFAFSAYQVVTGDLAEAIRTEPASVHHRFRRIMASLGAIAIVLGGVGVMVMPTLIPLVFGAKWQMAGHLAQYAMPVAAISFIAAPVNMVLLIAGRRAWQLAWEIGRFSAMLLTLLWLTAHPDVSPYSVMAAYAAVTVLCYVVFLVLADRALAAVSRGVVH